MTDLVERLREYASTGNRPSLWPEAMREAAAEIERLQEILTGYRLTVESNDREITRLEAEVARLKARLAPYREDTLR